MRNSFHIATTRAVSNPSTVSEYILPMLKKEGLGILYCGKWTDLESKNLEKREAKKEEKLDDIDDDGKPQPLPFFHLKI